MACLAKLCGKCELIFVALKKLSQIRNVTFQNPFGQTENVIRVKDFEQLLSQLFIRGLVLGRILAVLGLLKTV